jgi:hypothetical protein
VQSVREIAKFSVTQPHKAPPEATNLSTKLAFELDLHGLVRCTSVVQNHKLEVEVEEPAPAPAAKSQAKGAAEAPKADAEMADGDSAAAAAAAEGSGAGEEKAGGENGDAANAMEAEDAAAEPAQELEPPKPKLVTKNKKVRG